MKVDKGFITIFLNQFESATAGKSGYSCNLCNTKFTKGDSIYKSIILLSSPIKMHTNHKIQCTKSVNICNECHIIFKDIIQYNYKDILGIEFNYKINRISLHNICKQVCPRYDYCNVEDLYSCKLLLLYILNLGWAINNEKENN